MNRHTTRQLTLAFERLWSIVSWCGWFDREVLRLLLLRHLLCWLCLGFAFEIKSCYVAKAGLVLIMYPRPALHFGHSQRQI